MSKAETREQRREKLRKELDDLDFSNSRIKSIIIESFQKYYGSLPSYQSAVGCLFLCMMMGRRAMQIVHSTKTIAKYERILGIKFKELDFIKDKTENSTRSVGYNLAVKAVDFWDFVRGPKLPDNDYLTPPEGRIDFPPEKS